jgi:hypothetical protein
LARKKKNKKTKGMRITKCKHSAIAYSSQQTLARATEHPAHLKHLKNTSEQKLLRQSIVTSCGTRARGSLYKERMKTGRGKKK